MQSPLGLASCPAMATLESTPAKRTRKTFFKECWALIKPYWVSEERWGARLLLFVVVALNLGEVYLSVLFNHWNNDFYNSLQNVDKDAFYAALGRFSYLAFTFILVAVYQIYLNQMLRIKWRRWMTKHLLADWLGKQNYYRMQLLGGSADNPDQRISEDIEQFIQMTLSLSLGLLSSVVSLFSFLGILWGLSGALEFMVGGTAVHIPGYMVWVALVYAVFGTWITVKIGRPLVKLNFNQQRFEADFRFSLVRLRENSESIAFYKGEPQEQARFIDRFTHVVDNFWQIMKRQKTLTWITSGYQQLAIIFPFVVAAPRFFAKEIALGGLMQTASAFGRVQGALSYFVEAYTSIATWQATTDRLLGFSHTMRIAEALPSLPVSRQGEAIAASNLSVRLPDGRELLKNITLNVKPGDSLLITGPSGSGKSTLLRVLSGLWPFVDGQLVLPERASMMFVPQHSYLPLGTLRQVLFYPSASGSVPLEAVLESCGLAHLSARLDEEQHWAQILSGGEQQRVAFVRMLLARPDFIFMDEATSALDEPTEARLYELLKIQLPQSAIISVGHRSTLKSWHAETMKL